MGESVAWIVPAHLEPLRLPDLLLRHRMRPWIAETETRRQFLGSDLRRRFNHRAEWIALHTRILLVSVVNAPRLIACFRRKKLSRLHAAQ